MNGGSHQNALAFFIGTLEDNVAYHITLRFIHNIVFAPHTVHGKAGAAHHLVDLITVQPGGIYNVAGLKIPLGGVQAVAAIYAVNAGDGGGKLHLAAVHHRGFGQRQGKFPRADNSSRGRIKRSGHLFAHIRLQCMYLIGGQQLHTGNAVFQPLPVQHLQVALILLIEGQHQGTDLIPFDIQLFTKLLGQLYAAYVGFGHQAAGCGVVTGVKNGAVGFGGHIGHIVFRLQHQYTAVIPAQFIGGSSAPNSAADDGNIIHVSFLLYFIERKEIVKSKTNIPF